MRAGRTAALKYAKSLGHQHSLSICNVPESAIPRASELVCYTRAGAEIGVTSTKAFTTESEGVHVIRTPRHTGALSPVVRTTRHWHEGRTWTSHGTWRNR